MAKPILVIRLPESFSQSLDKVSKSIRKSMDNEYHVLTVCSEIEEVNFEVFNVDKEPEIKYSELKKLINKEVEA